MKKNKLISTFLLSISILGTTLVPNIANASEFNNDSNISTKQSVNVDSDDVIVSDLMTYDQLVEVVMKNENLSKKEALKFLGINENFKARGEFFRTYGKRITVDYNYKPMVQFYCKTSEWDNYKGISSVLNASLDRNYNGTVKQFGGSIYTNLEDANTIYYSVNGDFYNKGTTTATGGAEIGVGDDFTVNFSISGSSNYYAYCNVSDRFKLNK